MAKASTPAKKKVSEPKAKTSAKKKSSTITIETVSEQVVNQLQLLAIQSDLQNEIEWCLGSFRHDQNPAGLLQAGEKALTVLRVERAKSTKSVPAKLITDLEKVLKSK